MVEMNNTVMDRIVPFPQIHKLKSQPPIPQKVTVFGKELFNNIVK